MKQQLTYESAYAELTQIAREMETDAISVDILAEKVKRASELVAFCQSKLRSAENEVNNIIGQIEINQPK